MKQARTVVRMSATEWSVTIPMLLRTRTFDLRSMSKVERRSFHTEFMAAYRTHYYSPKKHRKAS